MWSRRVFGMMVAAIVAIALLGLPLVVGAQSSNGITSVKDGDTLNGSVEIRGNANAPSFWKWQLDLLPAGNTGDAIFLALGTNRGQFSYSLNTTRYPDGNHTLRLRVVRIDANYTEYITAITIANQVVKSITPTPSPMPTVTTLVAATSTVTATRVVTPTVAPTATATRVALADGITSLTSGATVSGTITISGKASDPAFQKWQLDLYPAGGDPSMATTLAVGLQQGSFTYNLDTTHYPNGGYALRLRVVKIDGNYAEYITQFTIANPLPTPQPTPPLTKPPLLPAVQGQD